MAWWVAELSASSLARKIQKRVIPNLRYLGNSEFRTCGACCRKTLFISLGPNDEFCLCIRCRANLRYEMLAEYIRQWTSDISRLDVLELDFSSPLRPILAHARSYTRSFYRPGIERGSTREDGAQCQDITNLTFPDASLDLIVSSDVLEHVPDPMAAFRETARVLRPGGAHIYTVPNRASTKQRARIIAGSIQHILTPEYHYDPLDPAGVLSFWDYGPDTALAFPIEGLKFDVVSGPKGPSKRIVWVARRQL